MSVETPVHWFLTLPSRQVIGWSRCIGIGTVARLAQVSVRTLRHDDCTSAAQPVEGRPPRLTGS